MNIAILSKGSSNYSTQRLKEEAIARGHKVRIINYSKCYITAERGNPAVHYRGGEVKDVDVIIPRISASLTKYGSSIIRQFEMQNIPTTASSIATVRSRDKMRAYQ